MDAESTIKSLADKYKMIGWTQYMSLINKGNGEIKNESNSIISVTISIIRGYLLLLHDS